MDEILSEIIENTESAWEYLKTHYGKEEAAFAVLSLVQEALKEEAIVITQFKSPEDHSRVYFRADICGDFFAICGTGLFFELPQDIESSEGPSNS